VTRILIATYPGDYHSIVVATALRHKGHEPVLWYAPDFPTMQRGTIEIEGREHSWSMVGEELDERSSSFDVVWFRRPSAPMITADLHPGDRQIAERACTAFYRAFWHLVAPDAFWVNPLASRSADIKPLQLIEAARIGFSIPPTLCSNDPARIRAFLDKHRGETVYKSFVPAAWETGEGIAHLFTSPVTLDDLPDDDLLQTSVGMFQRRIDKKHELRVNVIGERLFAAKLHSQQNELARQDWRRAFKTLQLEATELPVEVGEKCIALMKRLGLVFGCFDLIVTNDDEYVFLEVNPMGAFLWVEETDPSILVTDAFCELLIQGKPQFEWTATRATVRYAELRDEALAFSREAERRHVKRIDRRSVSDSVGPEDPAIESRGNVPTTE
jgi:glutathione synthase/RimK-type ligase-like ATP-grasp enzyme